MQDNIPDVDDDTGFEQFVREHVLHERPTDVPDRNQEREVGDPDLLEDFKGTRNVHDTAWGCEIEF